ncbi:MAG: hypothetical protein HY819_19315 [Acidobacteria bacterium]|nr:hypothetical protein [Acidobacteriota bacterium]
MAKIKIKQQSFPKRCDICHQTDLFDAENNVCSRCVLVKDLTSKAYESSTRANPSSMTIITAGNIELMTLIQIGAIVFALIAAFVEIRTILLTGPILSSIGGVIAWTSYQYRSRLGMVWGLSAVAITLFCLGLILIFEWSPSDAQTPIQIIGLIYTILILPITLTILLHLRRKNPKGTFKLRDEKPKDF